MVVLCACESSIEFRCLITASVGRKWQSFFAAIRPIALSPPGGYSFQMAHDHVHESHPKIVKRLKRAEGHLRRVIAMFDEGRSCLDLAQQLQAVEKAVGEAKRTLIHDHVDHCLDTAANGTGKSIVAVVDEFKAISKYL
jgi:DNA-binding FrmR family transcriptional regulator